MVEHGLRADPHRLEMNAGRREITLLPVQETGKSSENPSELKSTECPSPIIFE